MANRSVHYNYGSRKIYRKFHITRDVNEEQTPFFYQSTDSSIDQVILMSSVYLFLTSLNKLCRTLLDFGCFGFVRMSVSLLTITILPRHS